MKLKVKRDELLSALQMVNKTIPSAKGSMIPILDGILFSTEGDKLKLSHTNLEIGIEYPIQANIIEEGKVVIPLKYILDITRLSPEESIDIEVNSGDRADIKSGNAFYQIQGMSAEEFPVISNIEEKTHLSIPSSYLSEMIHYTSFASYKTEDRANLTGVLFKVGKGALFKAVLEDDESEERNIIEMVATDGHRLADKRMVIEESPNVSSLIPYQAMEGILKLLSEGAINYVVEVEVIFGEAQVMFKIGDINFVSRLIDLEFPNYNAVIPTEWATRVTGEIEGFLSALERVSLISRKDSNVVILHIGEDTLTITSKASEIGQAKDIIPIEREGFEEELEIAFDYRLLLDVLKVMKNDKRNKMVKFAFELIDPLKSGIIRNPFDRSYIYVVMPVKITN